MGEIAISIESEFFGRVFEEHLKDRKIIINGDIAEDIVETAMLQILKWNEEDLEKIPEARKNLYGYFLIVLAVMSVRAWCCAILLKAAKRMSVFIHWVQWQVWDIILQCQVQRAIEYAMNSVIF